jgi:hypothetical protein
MDNPITPDVTPETRDNLLKTLEANATEAIACLRTIQSSLAIDGPLLKPEHAYTKEQVIDMLRQAYNLGATAHEESMTVRTNSWSDGIEVNVEVSDGGFTYDGDVTVDADTIKEAVRFDDHEMTDEQVEEILNA